MAFVVAAVASERLKQRLQPLSRRSLQSSRPTAKPFTRVTMMSRGTVMDGVVQWIENEGELGKVELITAAGSSGWASMSRVKTDTGKEFFVKQSSRGVKEMFEGEAEGLIAMYKANAIMVPRVYKYGQTSSGSYIIMDHLNLRSGFSQKDLGEKLAEMHLAVPAAPEARSGKFGFVVSNTIGGTSQPNEWMDNWVDFFREKRLGHQIRLAKDATISELGKKLLPNLEAYFEGLDIKPCILHGDLWSGNIGGVDGKPVIYDPACYYGHSEAEFGMSWCAGFSGDFYDAYHRLVPREPGFEKRKQLYLLYHYLNHYNLFGGGYLSQAVLIMKNLVG